MMLYDKGRIHLTSLTFVVRMDGMGCDVSVRMNDRFILCECMYFSV